VSVILVSENGERIRCNMWNWRPTLALIERAQLLPPETIARASHSGAGAVVTASEALAISVLLDSHLAGMAVGQRVGLDGSSTSTPDDHKLDFDN
jgi:hypothetical protein